MGNRVYAVLDRHTRRHHGDKDFCRQGGEDICLYAAAKSVGEHNRHVVLVVYRHDAVAAKLLALLVQAHKAALQEYIFHKRIPSFR